MGAFSGRCRNGRSLTKRESAFTLAEFLVVAGVLGILLVAAVVGVRSVSRATSRNTAVNSMMNAIEGARALAITKGRPTFLVFADEDAPADYAFRAYAVFQAGEDFGAASIQVTKWQTLPRGVSFRTPGNNPILNAPSATFPMPGQANGTECPFIQFDPRGGVESPTDASDLRLVLFEGAVEGSVEIAGGDSVENGNEIRIARSTGRANYFGNQP